MNKKDLLVTVVDKNNIEAAKQLIYSAKVYGEWDQDMMVIIHIDENLKISNKQLEWFKDNKIILKKAKPLYDKTINLPPVVFTRFYIFKKEFKKWHRIIYLDADIIVNSSILKLKKLKGFNAAKGTPESKKLKSQFRNKNSELFKKIKKKYNMNSKTFNAGVLIFTTDIIKNDNFNQLNEMIYKYENIIQHQDQSILNLYFYKKWKKIPLKYNFYLGNHRGWKLKDTKYANIIHFVGLSKPWDKNNIFYDIWKKNIKNDNKNVIKINKIKKSANIRNEIEYIINSKRKKREIIKKILENIKRVLRRTYHRIRNFIKKSTHSLLGKIGRAIKKKNKKLYYKLKRGKNEEKITDSNTSR